MDKQLDRLRELIDEFDSVLVLRRKVDYLEAKVEDLKVKAKNLMQLVEMANFAAQYYEFTGTIKHIEKKGSQIVVVLWDGPKQVRFILGDNRCPPNLQEGCTVRIQADIIPITITWSHKPGGFIQGSSVREIEILKN